MCNNCGAVLTQQNRLGTRNLTAELPEFITNPVFTAAGSGVFKRGMRLRIDIEGQNADIKVDPSKKALVIGRRDSVTRSVPDIDFEDFDGYRLGVSRRHAVLTLQTEELVIQDYGSANGTFLNGVRLPAHRAHKLHDGDEIRLGRLSVRVYFV